MIVLGISDGHDAGAALLVGGEIVFAVSEERLARRRRAQGFPGRAVAEAFRWAGLGLADVDLVCVAGTLGRGPFRILDGLYARSPASRSPLAISSRLAALYENEWASRRYLGRLDVAASRIAMRRRLDECGLGGCRLETAGHHEAHVATAWLMVSKGGAAASRTLAVSLDGFGEGLSGAVAAGGIAASRWVAAIPWRKSLGLVYGTVAAILGFDEGDEGKVTGLAARGDPGRLAPFFERAIPWVDDEVGWSVSPEAFGSRFWAPLAHKRPEDVAAGLQARVEQAVVRFLSRRMDLSGATSIACAGGLFANVLLNGEIARLARARGGDLAVFPHMGDGGLCVGAAAIGWLRATRKAPRVPSMPPLWGPEAIPERAAIAARSAGFVVTESGPVHARIASLLAAGKIVARVEGRMEFGPRALGPRSILFAATDPAIARRVSEALGRPDFMPFAPAIVAGEAGRLLECLPPPGCAALMTVAVRASAEMRSRYPGAVHLDGTVRPQIVDERSPDIEKILLAYRAATGHGVLVNTSFNRHGEPIVCSSEDAFATFARSPGIDVLAAGPFVVERRPR